MQYELDTQFIWNHLPAILIGLLFLFLIWKFRGWEPEYVRESKKSNDFLPRRKNYEDPGKAGFIINNYGTINIVNNSDGNTINTKRKEIAQVEKEINQRKLLGE